MNFFFLFRRHFFCSDFNHIFQYCTRYEPSKSVMVGSTLEMDSGHKNNKWVFIRISTIIFKDFLRSEDFHIYMQKELLVRSARMPLAPSLRSQ